MRTTTLRGLAAGAGAAAVLVAGAGTAAAVPGQSTAAFWEGYYAEQGYEDVVCGVSVVPGEPGVLDVVIGEDWASSLQDGNTWIGAVINVGGDYDVHAWEGYGTYHYDLDVPDGSAGSITHVIGCQAPADSGPTKAAGDADGTTKEPVVTEEPASTDQPSGPPIETDGPATPGGTNLGMLGGAALVLAGAGAAGWAMRRRPGQH